MRPPAIMAVPFPLAGLADERGEAGQACDLLAVERAELRQFGDEGAGWDRPHAGNGSEQVLLVAPYGRTVIGSVDLRINLGQLPLERGDQAGDALFDALDLNAPLPIALGDHHLDDLTPTRDEIAKQLGRFVGERQTTSGLVASTKRATIRASIGSSSPAAQAPGRNGALAPD